MPNKGNPQSGNGNGDATLEVLLQRLGEVPDLLVTVELRLRPLARGDKENTPEEARHVIGNACDQVHMALGRVLDVLRNLPEMSSLGTGSHPSVPTLPAERKNAADGRAA